MASELKPWRYEIKYGPDGEDSYSWVYDDHGAMVATMKTHKAKQIVDAMNTRPAPAATDTGLETAEYQVRSKLNGHWVKDNFLSQQLSPDTERRELVTRSQAEELLASKDKEIASLIPRAPNCGRYLAECNDGQLMYLNHAGKWQECPNFIMAKDARVKELEDKRIEDRFTVVDEMEKREALEAKLAAAEKINDAMRKAAVDYCWQRYKGRDPLNLKNPAVFTSHEWEKIGETMDAAARAVLGGKPS